MDAFAAIRIMVMGLGLRADHAEVADVYRLCRIAQVVDLQVIAAVHPSFELLATRYAMPVSHSHQLLCVPVRLSTTVVSLSASPAR